MMRTEAPTSSALTSASTRAIAIAVARVLVTTTALLTAPACRRDPPTEGAARPTATASTASSSTTAAPPASASARSARLDDPRWRLADGDDPLERARLAHAEGAAGLLDALHDGGAIATTALRSLPHAPDADLALGPLAERALGQTASTNARPSTPTDLDLLLQTILEIAGRPPPPREPLDPEGARAAAAAMVQIARRRDLPLTARAIAVSAARALAARGYLDPAEIPADLDPD